MSSNLYVGNLTFNTTSGDLESLFGQHGEVTKAQVITDRDTGRSHGLAGTGSMSRAWRGQQWPPGATPFSWRRT